MSRPRPWRVGVTLALAAMPLTGAVVARASLALRPEADPVAVIWAEHSAFVDRALVTAYLTAALALTLAALARRFRAVGDDRTFHAALALGAGGALFMIGT